MAAGFKIPLLSDPTPHYSLYLQKKSSTSLRSNLSALRLQPGSMSSRKRGLRRPAIIHNCSITGYVTSCSYQGTRGHGATAALEHIAGQDGNSPHSRHRPPGAAAFVHRCWNHCRERRPGEGQEAERRAHHCRGRECTASERGSSEFWQSVPPRSAYSPWSPPQPTPLPQIQPVRTMSLLGKVLVIVFGSRDLVKR
ncbi:uncharacterized protein LOC134764216 [Penaeus indicus]|uniref:uncharacterized protein LOC134764216 n=1 Tax=Penaeus indicus TaxID=29960 RepID=UPI00300CFF8B